MSQISLDPENWAEFRQLAHRMVDQALDHVQSVDDRPAWQQMGGDVRARLSDSSIPWQGEGEAAVYEQFLADVQPYANGSTSPRHFGWVHGNGFPFAMMAELLASEMNAHLAGYDQAPAMVERQVVEWMRQIMGFPEGASGLLLSGGSMANFTALAVARNAQAPYDIREEGLRPLPRMMVYGATETHSWAKKSIEVLGLGRQSFRQIPVDEHYTMDIARLRGAIEEDIAIGRQPAVVIGTAGTVNTGATDDLNALADLCEERGLWFHVDGAFGALLAVSKNYRHVVAGMERADSLAFDLHKWMYLPFEIACLLVRDGAMHRAAFSQSASYLATLERGVAAGGFPFADLGLELTRGFKALKAWMSFKAYGLEKFGALIERNIQQAQFFADLIRKEPELELMADVPMNIVCFRYRDSRLTEDQLDVLNVEILLRLQEEGIAIPSSTTIDEHFAIRLCIVNHRTKEADLIAIVASIIMLAKRIKNGRTVS